MKYILLKLKQLISTTHDIEQPKIETHHRYSDWLTIYHIDKKYLTVDEIHIKKSKVNDFIEKLKLEAEK